MTYNNKKEEQTEDSAKGNGGNSSSTTTMPEGLLDSIDNIFMEASDMFSLLEKEHGKILNNTKKTPKKTKKLGLF